MCYEEEPRALAEVRRQCQWAGCGVTVARWLRRLGGCCGACARNCLAVQRAVAGSNMQQDRRCGKAPVLQASDSLYD
jgi:hypothetical protein